MIKYAHRGNLAGQNPETENTLAAINNCLLKGIRVEIDIRERDGKLYLGHDTPQEEIGLDFLAKNRFMLLAHCKTLETVKFLNQHYIPFLHYFLQEDEMVVDTSLAYKVHHQRSTVNKFGNNDIVVDLDNNKCLENCAAVVTDYVND